jgi:signal transduction histidine kinase
MRRSSVAIIAVFCFLLLLVLNIIFNFQSTSLLLLKPAGIKFGASAFVSLIFLSSGLLVWMYARDRRVALRIFGFSCAITLAFVMLGGVNSSDKNIASFFDLVSSCSIALSVPFLNELLLVFPYDYLAKLKDRRPRVWKFVNIYRVLIWGGSFLTIVTAFSPKKGALIESLVAAYYLVGIIGLFTIGIVAYKSVARHQARTQFRIFLFGLILALLPVLIFTILPSSVNIPHISPMDGQISALALVVFPLALSYSVLRYQILVFDRYIRRIVAWIFGVVGMFMLGYMAIVGCSVLLNGGLSLALVGVAIVMGVCGSFVWSLAKYLTDRIFFNDTLHYEGFINKPDKLANETFNLDEAARVLLQSMMDAFETKQVSLFILNNNQSYFTLLPALTESSPNYIARQTLLKRINPLFSLSVEGVGVFQREQPLIRFLEKTKRPLLLSEISAAASDTQSAPGIGHYFSGLIQEDSDVLLAPVRAQGDLIGVLVLGDRGEHEPYSGPDFEVINHLLDRFSPVLETARVMLALRDAYERQKELDQLKDEFIVIASHELRTPLTAVQGYLELFNEQDLPQELQKRFIEIALHNCDELVLMVENIMKASQLDLNKKQIKLGPVSLHEVLISVVSTMEASINVEKRVVTLDASPDVQVLSDEHYLRLVMLNLLGNALKYSPAGTPIEIICEPEADVVQIRVRDFGKGITRENQKKLFARFARLEEDMNSPVRGVGLGLYICKSLIEAMHGTIRVESEGILSEGSAFICTLKRVTVYHSSDFGELEGVVSQL